MIVPGLLEGLDFFESKIGILRTVEIKVRWISLAAPDEIVFCKHGSPGLMVVQINRDSTLVGLLPGEAASGMWQR
jgi:hypothetical protein